MIKEGQTAKTNLLKALGLIQADPSANDLYVELTTLVTKSHGEAKYSVSALDYNVVLCLREDIKLGK